VITEKDRLRDQQRDDGCKAYAHDIRSFAQPRPVGPCDNQQALDPQREQSPARQNRGTWRRRSEGLACAHECRREHFSRCACRDCRIVRAMLEYALNASDRAAKTRQEPEQVGECAQAGEQREIAMCDVRQLVLKRGFALRSVKGCIRASGKHDAWAENADCKRNAFVTLGEQDLNSASAHAPLLDDTGVPEYFA
jgi:hypothetical protein